MDFITSWLIGLVPVWAWWLLGFFAVLFVIGVIWRFKDVLVLIKKIAGWPGVAAVLGVLSVFVYLIWPKQSSSTNKPMRARKQTPRLKRGDREFDYDTGLWKEKKKK